MNYAGWAFKPNEKELSQEIRERYAIVTEKLKGKIDLNKSPAYGHTRFTAVVDADIADDLDPMDVLIYADHGNLCFGGSCSKSSDGRFSGSYNTD